MIIIGNKPYKNIDISEIIDLFDKNMRFNFGLPGYNNGSKKYIQITNPHVRDVVTNNNLLYENPGYKFIDNIYKLELKKELNKKDYLGGIIYLDHNRKYLYNKYLKENKCPYTLSTLPRMGIHGVITSAIENKRPFVTHFSINIEDNRLHQYNNLDNHNIFFLAKNSLKIIENTPKVINISAKLKINQ